MKTQTPIRVMAIDDHQILRAFWRLLFFPVVARAGIVVQTMTKSLSP